MTNSIKFDLHTHHERCGHAIGTIEDYVKQAIQYGLQYIGISDHSPYFHSEEDQSVSNGCYGKESTCPLY